MKIGKSVISLFLAAGFAATSSASNSGVGLGNMYGISGGTSFEGNQRQYTNPTTEPLGQDARSMQSSMSEDPDPLPPGWSEHFDQSSGQYYYYNSLDGTTTWNRPATENGETAQNNKLQQSAETAEIEANDCTAVTSERNGVGSQESQKVEDSRFGYQESWDPQHTGIPQGQLPRENAVQSLATNQESQRGDTSSLSGQMSTDVGDRERWSQPYVVPQQVENRESLQLTKTAKDNPSGDLKEQSASRNPGFIENGSSEDMASAERQGNKHRDWGVAVGSNQEQPRGGWGFPNQGIAEPDQRTATQPPSSTSERREMNSENIPHHSQFEKASEVQDSRQRGGWGFPNQGTAEPDQRTATQPPSSTSERREMKSENIPHHSQFGKASEVQDSRQVSSAGYSRTTREVASQNRPNSASQIQQRQPGHGKQINGAEHEHRQQVVGGNSAANGQSFTRQQHPSFENGDYGLSASPRGLPPNPPHASRPEGPRPPISQPRYPNSQHPQQRGNSMHSQAQHRSPQYQQPKGNQRPPQYANYNYKNPQEPYNQQPSVGDAVTSVLEDGTATVKDVLGKSWQGLVGFSSRTREAMGQARDQVVTGASVAGQSISAKSTNWWGQAKSAFGSVFEKSDDTAPPQYNLSNQINGQPQPRYPNRQNTQRYHGQNPTTYAPTGARGQVPNSLQHDRHRSPGLHGIQGQQYPPQNGQIRRSGSQTRYDPPLPRHEQARPIQQPYQNQYQNPPRHSSHVDQQDRQVDRRSQQMIQEQHTDPWSHPGFSGDV